MRLINRKHITGFVAILILSFTVGTGCDDPYEKGVDYTKLKQEEEALRMDFFNDVRDSLMRISSDSLLDGMEERGWVSWELEKGSNDSVMVGKRVAFKYSYYYVLRDSLDKVRKVNYRTNYGNTKLGTYTVGAPGAQDTEVIEGVDLAIRHMNLHGKSFILMNHALAYGDYFPIVAEIEVVSVDLDYN